jgi:very-short-patch-repair endonuclease
VRNRAHLLSAIAQGKGAAVDADRKVAELAAGQHGVVGRRQALALGMTSPTLTRRLADGRLQRLLPGVYVVAGSVPSWHQRLMGACVAAGPGAAASHRAAGRLWGLLQGEQPLEVTVPLRKAPRIRHVAVHRSTDLTPDQLTRRRRIPVTNPLRTVVDLGAVLDPDDVEEALDRGLVSGLFSIVAIEHLLDRLARCGRSGCGVLRRVLDDRALGDERPDGLLEARMARLLRDAGLAPAVFQYVVRNEAGRFVAKTDFAYPPIRLALEVDGWSSHGSRRAFQDDRDRHNRLTTAGWTVLHFTWHDVVRRPFVVTGQIATFFAQ